MISRPRFLRLDNDRLYLMDVTYQKGQIVDIKGPYQCVSGPKEDAETFAKELNILIFSAVHESEILTLKDLPEKHQEEILNQFK